MKVAWRDDLARVVSFLCELSRAAQSSGEVPRLQDANTLASGIVANLADRILFGQVLQACRLKGWLHAERVKRGTRTWVWTYDTGQVAVLLSGTPKVIERTDGAARLEFTDLPAELAKHTKSRPAAEASTVLAGRVTASPAVERLSAESRQVAAAALYAVEQSVPATRSRRGRKKDPQTQALYEFCYLRWTDEGPPKMGRLIQSAANKHFGKKVVTDPRFVRQFAERFATRAGRPCPCPEASRLPSPF